MTQPDPCSTDDLLPVDEARQRILELVTPVTGEEVVALRSALGRVLARPLVSPTDVPPQRNSAMDGWALRGADLGPDGAAVLTQVGSSYAGAPWQGHLGPGECLRIMTGALLPDGADTVAMQEDCQAEGQRVRIAPGQRPGAHVRHPGEDLRRGDLVLDAGSWLDPAALGVAASLGLAELRVWRRPRVAFFSTGDELCGIGQPLGPGQIHDSNRYTLFGMLTRLGLELIDLGVIPDRRDTVHAGFAEAARIADVVITSGGVSVGSADFVHQALRELGEVGFWRIRMKPGKPLAVGRLGQALFFGLPGNPVSVMATFYQFVQPALQALSGRAPVAPLLLPALTRGPLRKSPGRLEYQRGLLGRDPQGRLTVASSGAQGSHILSSMTRADCFIILPADCGDLAPGSPVEVQPFAGLI